MATVVAVMDRPSFGANTDVIVVVDDRHRTLLWVPRDLWCDGIADRINAAYADGGADALLAALGEHAIEATNVLCLLPAAIEAALEGVEIAMPVRERLELWYPLERQARIEAGRKRVVFKPPVERLAGERVHQWIGARYSVDGAGSDLDRIARQQELVAVLLGAGFDFSQALHARDAVRASHPAGIEELRAVRADWRVATLPGLVPVEIEGKKVLVGPPRS